MDPKKQPSTKPICNGAQTRSSNAGSGSKSLVSLVTSEILQRLPQELVRKSPCLPRLPPEVPARKATRSGDLGWPTPSQVSGRTRMVNMSAMLHHVLKAVPESLSSPWAPLGPQPRHRIQPVHPYIIIHPPPSTFPPRLPGSITDAPCNATADEIGRVGSFVSKILHRLRTLASCLISSLLDQYGSHNNSPAGRCSL